MAVNNLNYNRLIYLNQQLRENRATKAEKDEYMELLYNDGSITKDMYDNYITNHNAMREQVLHAALAIGGIMLFAYLIQKLLSK